MNVMLTGAAGVPGRAIRQALEAQGCRVIPLDSPMPGDPDGPRAQMNADALRDIMEAESPDWIIHSLPYDDADRAETEPETCMAINAGGTLALALAAQRCGASLLLLSDVTVFGGPGDRPWEVTDKPNPQSVRGLSVLQAEEAVRGHLNHYSIVRTGWIMDAADSALLAQARLQSTLSLPGDWVGSITFAPDLAAFVGRLIAANREGTWHAANEGFCSRAEAAQTLFLLAGAACTVRPVPSPDPLPASRRPLNARLSTDSLPGGGFERLPAWRDSMMRGLSASPLLRRR